MDRYDKFTEQAHQILKQAEVEARKLNSNYIGGEHILLALITDDNGAVTRVLQSMGIASASVRSAVEYISGSNLQPVDGTIDLSPRARKALDLAYEEASILGHNYAGPEHLLLGLIHEGESIAAGVLESMNVELNIVRQEVLKLDNWPEEGQSKLVRPEVAFEEVIEELQVGDNQLKRDLSKIKIAPSILSADFARLGEQVKEAEAAGADYIHFDVMDGMFVPNITVGPLVLEALRPITNLPMDVHLMIEQPDRYLDEFAQAGARVMMVHQENVPHLHRTVQHITGLGCRAGVVLNPATPISTLEEILPYISRVLIMSVNPGFGGQSYIETSTAKISRLREWADRVHPGLEIEVDGGIKAGNIKMVAEAGADVIVTGSAVFNREETVAEAMAKLRHALQ